MIIIFLIAGLFLLIPAIMFLSLYVENPDHIRRNPMIFRPFPDIIRSKMSKSQLRILSRSISVVVAQLSIS